MGKLILYGTLMSPPVRAVLLTIKALELDVEFKDVNLMQQEHLSEDYVQKNPQHTVPLLEDDGQFIWESHAIMMYLVDQYGNDDSLYSKDLYQRAIINQRLFFEAEVLFAKLRSLVRMIVFEKNPNIPKENFEAFYEVYNFLEKFLENGDYLVGNNLTIADFSCIATTTSVQAFAPIDSGKYPKLSAWMDRMAELPYYNEANGKGLAIVLSFFQEKMKELMGQ